MDIKIEHLKKSYNHKTILQDINLFIPQNTCLGIMGESSSGKSTLGRILVGLEDFEEGKIFYDGAAISNVSKAERKIMRRKVQIVFQNAFAAVNPHFTMAEVLIEPFKFMGDKKPKKKEIEEKIDSILQQVGLDHLDRLERAQHLSGGQLQRLCIARALVTEPEVLILDEALSGLDYLIQKQLLKLLATIKDTRNITYFFIVHDFLLAYYLCDQVIIMDKGTIVDTIDLHQDKVQATHPKSQKLLGDFFKK